MITDVYSHQIPNIWITQRCAAHDKCVLTCGSCPVGRIFQVALRSSVPRGEAKEPAHSLSGWLACLLLKQAAPHAMLSCRFYRERNKVLCLEESGRTLVFNLSQLLFVWVLWAEMRRKMKQCTSHLGIVGAAEESALVSRFIRKTNKGKYSLKMQQKSQLRIRA